MEQIIGYKCCNCGCSVYEECFLAYNNDHMLPECDECYQNTLNELEPSEREHQEKIARKLSIYDLYDQYQIIIDDKDYLYDRADDARKDNW